MHHKLSGGRAVCSAIASSTGFSILLFEAGNAAESSIGYASNCLTDWRHPVIPTRYRPSYRGAS